MTTAAEIKHLQDHGLYSKSNEHDACGLGFVAHIKGQKRHDIVLGALKILENIDHRGAVGADPLMGDGAGILIQIPDQLYREEMAKQGVTLPPAGEYGVGMIFLPKEHASRLACQQEMERAIKAENQVLLGWRDVPVNRDMPMSPTVRTKEPILRQVFIGRGNDVIVQDALERKLYVIRKTASAAIQALGLKHSKEYYVPSMSSRTVVYKGLLLADQVGVYYKDLSDERCVSAIGLVHQRFSTNTFPEWPLAHPYRYVAHNGEINTVRGNYNWMLAREGVMASPVLGEDLQKLYPISFAGQSDTATFDNCLELLTMAGYPISQAVMMMIPEPWEQHEAMDERRRAFYEYHAAMIEPWDGPASIVFTDGRQIGATLDRNGLRPSRYCITDDDMVILASEAGVLPVPDSKIVRKWRLQPGKMLLIDLEQGRMIEDDELKANVVNTKPYKQWIENLRIKLDEVEIPADFKAPVAKADLSLLDRQQAFGFTQEDIKFLLTPMAELGEEGPQLHAEMGAYARECGVSRLLAVGAYAVFWPMHYTGMAGVPRRYYSIENFESFKHFTGLNQFITVAAIVVFFLQIIFIVNFFYSIFSGRKLTVKNPWGATTLEWTTPIVPGHGNWPGKLPTVQRWAYDYGKDGEEFIPQYVPLREGEHDHGH